MQVKESNEVKLEEEENSGGGRRSKSIIIFFWRIIHVDYVHDLKGFVCQSKRKITKKK